MSTIYSTRNEAIQNEIIASLGDYVDQHNIDAIADQLIIMDTDNGEATYHVDEDADFWAIAEANAI